MGQAVNQVRAICQPAADLSDSDKSKARVPLGSVVYRGWFVNIDKFSLDEERIGGSGPYDRAARRGPGDRRQKAIVYPTCTI